MVANPDNIGRDLLNKSRRDSRVLIYPNCSKVDLGATVNQLATERYTSAFRRRRLVM